jgi:hypothetical protein
MSVDVGVGVWVGVGVRVAVLVGVGPGVGVGGPPTPPTSSLTDGFEGSLLVIVTNSTNELGVVGANPTLMAAVAPGAKLKAPAPDCKLKGGLIPVLLTLPVSVAPP